MLCGMAEAPEEEKDCTSQRQTDGLDRRQLNRRRLSMPSRLPFAACLLWIETMIFICGVARPDPGMGNPCTSPENARWMSQVWPRTIP